jgi:D-arginine dehydrogenase
MTHDFIVIGAGIAGTSLAYELARSNRVCLIEGESRPGLHATGRSAALFAPSYGGRAIRAITRASRSFFDSPPAGFCEHPLLKPRGCLYIARQDQCARLHQMTDGIRASGGGVTALNAYEAQEKVPSLRHDYVAEAAFDADGMDIDVNALQGGFLRGARAAGARVVVDHWIRDAQWRDGAWCIELNDGPVSAPVLINAAGAWADEVAQACGARPLGLQALRRTAVLVDAPGGVDIRHWPAVIDADEQFYFKPEAGKLLLSPADETPTPPCDVQPEDIDVAIGVDRVQAALDFEVQRVRHRWAGLRTFSPDRAPVVGFDTHVPGFFWCAGQGGYGIQSAPAMARTAAALAMQQALPADVAAEGLAAEDLSPRRLLPSVNRRQG